MKKLLLISTLALTLALTACSSNKEPVDTPATLRPEEETGVTVTPVEEKEEVSEKDSEDKNQENKEESKEEIKEENDSKEEATKDDNLSAKYQISDELSDDKFSFQIQIDDEVYTLPMKYSELKERGFEFKGAEDTELKSGFYMSDSWNRGELRIWTKIINAGDSSLPISECYVGAISVDKDYNRNQEVFAVLPGGITYDKSTLDEVKAVYGEPSEIREDAYYSELTYILDSYQEIIVAVGVKSGVVDELSVENLVVE